MNEIVWEVFFWCCCLKRIILVCGKCLYIALNIAIISVMIRRNYFNYRIVLIYYKRQRSQRFILCTASELPLHIANTTTARVKEKRKKTRTRTTDRTHIWWKRRFMLFLHSFLRCNQATHSPVVEVSFLFRWATICLIFRRLIVYWPLYHVEFHRRDHPSTCELDFDVDNRWRSLAHDSHLNVNLNASSRLFVLSFCASSFVVHFTMSTREWIEFKTKSLSSFWCCCGVVREWDLIHIVNNSCI